MLSCRDGRARPPLPGRSCSVPLMSGACLWGLHLVRAISPVRHDASILAALQAVASQRAGAEGGQDSGWQADRKRSPEGHRRDGYDQAGSCREKPRLGVIAGLPPEGAAKPGRPSRAVVAGAVHGGTVPGCRLRDDGSVSWRSGRSA